MPVHQAPADVHRVTFVASPTGVELAVAKLKIKMSSAEWQQRFQAMLAAGAFQDEQRRILANARVDDDAISIEATTAEKDLTTQEISGRVQAMLEANPALLTQDTLAELTRVIQSKGKRGDDGLTPQD
jgi:hypothetical protein